MFNFGLNIFVFFMFFFLLRFFTLKYNFLVSQTAEKHQKFVSQTKIPTIGGILLISVLAIYGNIFDNNFNLLIFPVFLLGLIADLKILKSPKIRLIFQVLIIIFIVNYFHLTVNDLRIDLINHLLTKDIFAIFFVSFCILTIMNGTNFIDGLNGLVLILYFIIFNFLVFLDLLFFLNLPFEKILYLNLIFLIMIFLNLSNKIYLGDNGVYIITIFVSYLIIKSYENNISVSPYYYAILLWYPAFENLFSILRKIFKKKSPDFPDNLHLHHLIYLYFRSQFFDKSDLFINNFSGLIINLFNLIVICVASQNIFYTNYLVIILFTCCFFYIGLYFFLLKKLNFNFTKN